MQNKRHIGRATSGIKNRSIDRMFARDILNAEPMTVCPLCGCVSEGDDIIDRVRDISVAERNGAIKKPCQYCVAISIKEVQNDN